MELTLSERARLFEILPHEGNFQTLRKLREFREALAFSEEEVADPALGVKNIDGQISWIETGATADIPVGEVVTGLIVTTLKTLNEQSRLPESCFSLYEKFIENEKE